MGQEITETIRHAEGVVALRDRLSYPPLPRRASGPLIWGLAAMPAGM
jgi:hypothetical protein